MAGDRQLHLVGRVFEQHEPSRRRRQHRHRARLAQAERALHIGSRRSCAPGSSRRRVFVDDSEQAIVDGLEALAAARCCAVRMVPAAICRTGRAALDHAEASDRVARVHSDHPHPSTPITTTSSPLTASWPRAAKILGRRELRQLLVADIEIGGDALDVFVVLELLHQLQHLLGGMARNPYGVFGNP